METDPCAGGGELDFGGGFDAVGSAREEVAVFELDGKGADVEIAEVEVEPGGVFDKTKVEGALDDFHTGEGFEVARVEGGVEDF